MSRIGNTNTRIKTYHTSEADPGFAAELAAGAPLFDLAHPDRSFMRELTRNHISSPFAGIASLLQLTEKLDLEYKMGTMKLRNLC